MNLTPHFRPATLGLLLALVAPAGSAADKPDKAEKQWPDSVRALILPEEEKIYKSLKESADRQEFQKIFWARRKPDLEAETNEYKDEFEARKAEADKRFAGIRGPGSTTDCGRVYIVFGDPDSVQKEQSDTGMPMPGQRNPESWTYRDKPGVQTFTGGQLVIPFGAQCDAPQGFQDSLRRIGSVRVVRPDIEYKMDKGRLLKLEELLPKPTPVRALVKAPRQDFPSSTRVFFLKTETGGTALFGVIRGEATGFAVEEISGRKMARVALVARALLANGKEAGYCERTILAPVAADGSFVGAFSMGMQAGRYTLHAGALDEKSAKGSIASQEIDVPNLSSGELSIGSVLVLTDIEDIKEGATLDPTHPFSVLRFGSILLHPVPAAPVSKSRSVMFAYQVYDLKVDPVTGKADTVVTLDLLRAGRPVVKAAESTFETAMGAQTTGALALAGYEPGTYTVRVKARDNLAKINRLAETTFEVVP